MSNVGVVIIHMELKYLCFARHNSYRARALVFCDNIIRLTKVPVLLNGTFNCLFTFLVHQSEFYKIKIRDGKFGRVRMC